MVCYYNKLFSSFVFISCDLLERPGCPAAVTDSKISLTFKPFQIVSLLLQLH